MSDEWRVLSAEKAEGKAARSTQHSSLLWGLTDGSAGMRSQVQGLLAELGEPYVMKNSRRTHPWLPAWWRWGVLKGLTKESDALMPPWPRALISSGRRSVPLALAVQKASGGHTRLIHLTDPRGYYNRFDLIVAMQHDRVMRPNVISTRFALHRITTERLQAEAGLWAPRMARMVKPLIAVLVGGSTNRYTLTPEAMKMVIQDIHGILAREKGSVLITPSRRTGEANIARLQQAFAGNPRVMVHNLNGENPYMAMLAVADYIVVTNDSVNMLSEVYATGKPLYILPLVGHQGTKPARFAKGLMADGIARPLAGRMQPWYYRVIDERAMVVEAVRKILAS